MFERTDDGTGYSVTSNYKGVNTHALQSHFNDVRMKDAEDNNGKVDSGLEAFRMYAQLNALTSIVSHLEARIIELENKLEQ